jgi:hypothetical protein
MHGSITNGNIWSLSGCTAIFFNMLCNSFIWSCKQQHWIVNCEDKSKGHKVHGAGWRAHLRAMTFILRFWLARLAPLMMTT